jgi:hypothetical protein
MGILNPRPKLEPGEHIMWQARANYVAGPYYSLYGFKAAAGGQLFVTDQRVFFEPSRADKAVGAKHWECSLPDAAGVEVVGPDGEVFAGGMRKRLGIRTKDGVEVFVVNKLEKTMAQLSQLLPPERANPAATD